MFKLDGKTRVVTFGSIITISAFNFYLMESGCKIIIRLKYFKKLTYNTIHDFSSSLYDLNIFKEFVGWNFTKVYDMWPNNHKQMDLKSLASFFGCNFIGLLFVNFRPNHRFEEKYF